MAKKFLLIHVCERQISVSAHVAHEEARLKMMEDLDPAKLETAHGHRRGHDYDYGDGWAYINGLYHEDYNWLIEEIEL